MTKQTELLMLLLDCKSLDINKLLEIIKVCEYFDDDALYNAIEDLKDNGMKINCNSLIEALLLDLRDAITTKISTDLNIDIDIDEDFEIFVNYLDSHIVYTGDDKQVKEWLEDNCDLVEF